MDVSPEYAEESDQSFQWTDFDIKTPPSEESEGRSEGEEDYCGETQSPDAVSCAPQTEQPSGDAEIRAHDGRWTRTQIYSPRYRPPSPRWEAESQLFVPGEQFAFHEGEERGNLPTFRLAHNTSPHDFGGFTSTDSEFTTEPLRRLTASLLTLRQQLELGLTESPVNTETEISVGILVTR